MAQIEMLQHYCGFRNGNADWLPGEIHEVDDDTAADLIERKYAKERTVAEQLTADPATTKKLEAPEPTPAGKASQETTDLMTTRRRNK